MLAPGCDYRRRKHFNVIVIIGSSGIVGAPDCLQLILHVLDLDLKMKELLVRLQLRVSSTATFSLDRSEDIPYRFFICSDSVAFEALDANRQCG